jgi:hypothetical protein
MTLTLPLQSILQRKADYLSDIVEQSNEAESNLQSGNTSDRKWVELNEIKEEEEHSEFQGLKWKTERCLPQLEK